MARFELTISGGEKFLVEHPAASMNELLLDLADRQFVLLDEVRSGSAAREVIVSTRQITLVRPLAEGSMQGSGFRAKR